MRKIQAHTFEVIGSRRCAGVDEKKSYIHGYKMKIKFEIRDLDNLNFKKWFKKFIKESIDHKMLLDLNDPLNEENVVWVLEDDAERIDREKLIWFEENYWIPDITQIVEYMESWEKNPLLNPKNKAIYEKYKGIVFVNFIPTSENIALWLIDIVQNKICQYPGAKLISAEYWESSKLHQRLEV